MVDFWDQIENCLFWDVIFFQSTTKCKIEGCSEFAMKTSPFCSEKCVLRYVLVDNFLTQQIFYNMSIKRFIHVLLLQLFDAFNCITQSLFTNWLSPSLPSQKQSAWHHWAGNSSPLSLITSPTQAVTHRTFDVTQKTYHLSACPLPSNGAVFTGHYSGSSSGDKPQVTYSQNCSAL